MSKFLTNQQVIQHFGQANKTGKGYLERITLPYPMRIAWNLNQRVTTVVVHKAVKSNFENLFKDLLAHYGLKKLQRLRIDVFGGIFNYRKITGGSNLSRHSWAIAIDLDPVNNSYRATSKTAWFAKKAYEPMIEIFEKNGFVSLGKERNFDWMHFEIGTAAFKQNDNVIVQPTVQTPITSRKTHTVVRGDSLWKIAHSNYITVDKLRQLNNLTGNLIHPGQILKLE